MTDMTNEPTGLGPDDVTPVEPSVAPTEPLPASGYETPTAEMPPTPGVAEPVYYAAPAEPVAPAAPAAPHDHISVSKRWLWIVGGIVLGVILLGMTFTAGVSVGRHAAFGGRGEMMRQFQGYGQVPGGQLPDGRLPNGQGMGRGQDRQRGGMQGWGGEQGWHQQGVPQGQQPNNQQNQSTSPTQ